jgi:hypothetical protein
MTKRVAPYFDIGLLPTAERNTWRGKARCGAKRVEEAVIRQGQQIASIEFLSTLQRTVKKPKALQRKGSVFHGARTGRSSPEELKNTL